MLSIHSEIAVQEMLKSFLIESKQKILLLIINMQVRLIQRMLTEKSIVLSDQYNYTCMFFHSNRWLLLKW